MRSDPHRQANICDAPLVFLMGPTAAGKTAVAIDLVERFPMDIVSVDSAMVYRGMNIGTGKPDEEALGRAPHRLVDIREPEQRYSAAEFRHDASGEIADIHARGRIPLLVGGTGLYFRALSEGLSAMPGADAAVRDALSREAGTVGWGAMHERLAGVDPDSAARIHRNDPQRIQRALEVHTLTGRPMSAFFDSGTDAAGWQNLVKVVLSPADRSVLHRRVEQRFDAMLAAGLVAEVEWLRSRRGLDRDLPSMRAVGYRQVSDFLDHRDDAAGMREKALAATRQLARRQLTWLRRESGATWFDSGGEVGGKLLTFLRSRLTAG